MKDAFYRKNRPDHELFRWEVAFDLRLRLLSVACAAFLILLLCRVAHSKKSARRRRQDRRIRALEKKLARRSEHHSPDCT